MPGKLLIAGRGELQFRKARFTEVTIVGGKMSLCEAKDRTWKTLIAEAAIESNSALFQQLVEHRSLIIVAIEIYTIGYRL